MSARQQRQGYRLSVKKTVDTVIQLKSYVQTPEVQQQLLRKGLLLSSSHIKLETFDMSVLEAISDETEVEKEIAEIREFNDKVEEAIADTQLLPTPSHVPPPANPGVGGAGNVHVHLPKLEIPAFDGDPIRWQEFWDAFKAAIHDRSDLATVDKLTYLRGLLAGEALGLVEGFRVTEANYREVVDLLTQRYGDKQAVVFAHIDALLSLPPASGDAASLVSTHTKLERHLRSLDSLQPDQDMILYSVILSKLPRFLKIEVHRQKSSQSSWSLTELRKWLSDEVRAREMGDRLHRLNIGNQDRPDPPFKGRSDNRNSPMSRKSASSAAALVSESREVRCPFCDGPHLAECCTVYPDAESRRTQLRDRCLICLWKGHIAKACRRKKPCKFCRRSGHHSCFCFAKFGKPKPKHDTSLACSSRSQSGQEASLGDPSCEATGAHSSVLLTSNGKSERTVMQTAVVALENKQGSSSVMARLFFDTGASRTFITETKRRELHLPTVSKELLSVSSFQSSRRQTTEHNMVEFRVNCRDGTVQPVVAAVVPSITCPILKVPLCSEVLAVPEWTLAEPLARASEYVELDVLIGMDYYYSFVSTQRIRGGDNLWFLSSKVGFLASGRVATVEPGAETVAVMFVKTALSPDPTEPPTVDFSKYWDLEEIGMKEDQKQGLADDEAISSFSSTVKFNDGRYQVHWPWKVPTLELKDNYGLALGRLRSLLNRLNKAPSTMDSYAAVFQAQLESGIIETAPATPTGNCTYYMPHHCVIKSEESTTKLRIVFDASSRVAKDVASLNDCLHRGPVLLEDLCGLLLRFRTHAVALVSDIEKAFLQIGLQPSQRDAVRFLWVRDHKRPPIGDNLLVYRFCRVPFGVISSPFLLAATVSHHLKRSECPVAIRILRDIYVDNVITGEASPSDSIQHYNSAKVVFRDAAMNLREWYSNSEEVLASIPDVDKGKQPEPKVLGIRWNPRQDTLRLSNVKPVDDHSPVTKRSILKTLPQVFDPCGFMAPVVVTGKLLLQDLWSSGLGWDDPVPRDVAHLWRTSILPNLTLVSKISIPRYIGAAEVNDYQMHVFCDASTRACAAAVYLRQNRRESSAKVDLLMAKSRLAPVKQKMTIPRLELVAVVLGARLLEFVCQHIGIELSSRFVWTDSQCVLHWLRKDQVSTRFIENRAKELRKLNNVQFKYCPTAENPADMPTRGCSVSTLSPNALWWHGPQWLQNSKTEWPSFPTPQGSEKVEWTPDQPVVKLIQEVNTVRVIDEERYSSLNRLLRVTAYVLRFGYNAKVSPPERRTANLLLEEVNSALKLWIKIIQSDGFRELCTDAKSWPKGIVEALGIFRDPDGILRCSGRFQLADLSYDTKHPILLPKTGHFTELVIFSHHLRGMHTGVASTLARVRQQFWVVNGRSVVKRVINNCRICRRFHGGPFRIPPVPPLPKFRLEDTTPFANTGLDYLGPLHVRGLHGEHTKVWIVLFTCAVTRAIHLEVAENMTTEHFLLALRRFIAIHGTPAFLVSDNGKQFRTASRLFHKWLSDANNSVVVQDAAVSRNIEWKFITEMAPWMGGFYERLVGVVKQALRKTLCGVHATLAELQTVVSEIGAVANSRPLVYVEDEVGSIPLCPTNLISPSRRDGLLLTPPQTDSDYNQPATAEILTARWRRLQTMVIAFWRTWRAHYLLSLRERHVTQGQRGASPWIPEVGTVVHLKQDLPRASWRLGRISALHISADGHTRTASVRLAGGQSVRRPLKLLYPLELDVTERSDGATQAGNDGIPHAPSTSTGLRPTRAAAAKARLAWRQQGQKSGSDDE